MDYAEKRKTIEALLDHWEDFTLPNVGGITRTTDGEGLGLVFASGMGRYPSVVELNRCLEVLAEDKPTCFKHVRGYYSSSWRVAPEEIKIKTASGKWVKSSKLARERLVPRWVRMHRVELGVVGLLRYWDESVPLELPPALNRKLREFTDQDGTHLTEAA